MTHMEPITYGHLLTYVREILRQRDLLQSAIDRDSLAQGIIQSSPLWPVKRQPNERRIWTRRDRRLLDELETCDSHLLPPRTERLLARVTRASELTSLRDNALREIREAGKINSLGDFVTNLDAAHRAYMQWVLEHVTGAEHVTSYGYVMDNHNSALRSVVIAVPEINEHW